VKQFIVDLRRKLDETYRREKWIYNGIDALCLNAGVLAAADSDPSFTQDGFETTFQTNHLSPFLIAHMTKGYINPGGRVILSTSGLHLRHKLELDGMVDPITGAVRKGFDMVNGKDYHYKDSYSMSKLCNVAVCAELNQILRDSNAISTCFSPGLMLESGLFRHQPLGEHPVPEPHRADVLRKAKSVDWGAGALAYMCWADEPGKVGAQYWRDESVQGNAAIYGQEFSPTPISEDTVDIKSRKLLWKFSCELAGVDCVQDGTYAYAVA
jgi:NAD(P)-dependent dehydrogenase (short-subunit alcohol dehydrogenase family)